MEIIKRFIPSPLQLHTKLVLSSCFVPKKIIQLYVRPIHNNILKGNIRCQYIKNLLFRNIIGYAINHK